MTTSLRLRYNRTLIDAMKAARSTEGCTVIRAKHHRGQRGTKEAPYWEIFFTGTVPSAIHVFDDGTQVSDDEDFRTRRVGKFNEARTF